MFNPHPNLLKLHFSFEQSTSLNPHFVHLSNQFIYANASARAAPRKIDQSPVRQLRRIFS